MAELHVDPRALEGATHAVGVEQRVAGDVAAALGPALSGVAAAVPGSRTARVAEDAGDSLSAGVRALAAELAVLAGALGVAAAEYATVDRHAATGLERAGGRPR